MRHIKESEFSNFTIVGHGWSATLGSLADALKHYKLMPKATLYGNKPDGTQAIIDMK